MVYQPAPQEVSQLVDFGLGVNYEQASNLLKVFNYTGCVPAEELTEASVLET